MQNVPAFRAHPWHGVASFSKAPVKGEDFYVNAYIEMTPRSDVKLEVHKDSGLLVVDRPQKYSNMLPCLYGFVPRTYCDAGVAKHTQAALFASGYTQEAKDCVGDQDPLDICVFTDRMLQAPDVLLKAKVVGGVRMLDSSEADDKILAVLCDDVVYGDVCDIEQLPQKVLTKIKHYFLTYKDLPGEANPSNSTEKSEEKRKIVIVDFYGCEEAKNIVSLASEDYVRVYREHS